MQLKSLSLLQLVENIFHLKDVVVEELTVACHISTLYLQLGRVIFQKIYCKPK